MCPTDLKGAANLCSIGVGTKVNDQSDNSTFPDLCVQINRLTIGVNPREHRRGAFAAVGVLDQSINIPLRQLFGVAFACHFVFGNSNHLFVGCVKFRDVSLWNLETDGTVVELSRRLKGIDEALKGGRDDETSFGHNRGKIVR